MRFVSEIIFYQFLLTWVEISNKYLKSRKGLDEMAVGQNTQTFFCVIQLHEQVEKIKNLIMFSNVYLKFINVILLFTICSWM